MRAQAYSEYAGSSFGSGIYRLYDCSEIERWTGAIEQAFPDYRGRVKAFGRDWLCNQFCLDARRRQDGEALVLLFEIGTGEVLEIPAAFSGFHEEELVDHADAALAVAMFRAWQKTLKGGALPPGMCAGYRVPLFLGGKDDVSNLELIDVDVYWHLTTQLLTDSRA